MKFADKIAHMTDKPLKLMEVCGGHYGLSSHLVYGLTTDLVRRSVRRLL